MELVRLEKCRNDENNDDEDDDLGDVMIIIMMMIMTKLMISMLLRMKSVSVITIQTYPLPSLPRPATSHQPQSSEQSRLPVLQRLHRGRPDHSPGHHEFSPAHLDLPDHLTHWRRAGFQRHGQ